jgi:hypothetical protein
MTDAAKPDFKLSDSEEEEDCVVFIKELIVNGFSLGKVFAPLYN